MKNIIIKISLTICLFGLHIHAGMASSLPERSGFAMKVGGGIGATQLRDKTNQTHISPNPLFTTQIAYQKKRWELAASSYVTLGRYKSMHFEAHDSIFKETKGRYRKIAITPTLKYFPNIRLESTFHPYLGLGVVWSHRTYNLGGSIQELAPIDLNNHKVNYESRGGILQLGLEQLRTEERKYPLFIEIAGIYTESRNVSLIDTSNFRKTEILSKRDAVNHMRNIKIYLSIGVTLF